MTYQWWVEGVPIIGATNPVLTIDPVEFTNEGGYSIVIGNAYGSITANAALVVSSVIAWGDNSYGQTNVPLDLTNIVAIASGQGSRSDRKCSAISGVASDGSFERMRA